MTSTYSDRLKLELMETGANANTWGNNTNTNLETLDAFSGGYLSKSVAGSSNVTLTSNNADPTAEASNKVIELTGALTGDIHVFIPAVENNYLIYNNTSGSQTVTVAATGHGANGAVISQGGWHWVYCDGSANFNVTEAEFTTTNASALTEGTLADARLSANVTLNNASTISAGTLADARLTANVTLNNASTISAGTLASDRLPTVPTTKGGTGLTSIGSAGQVLTVASPGSALEFADAGGGGYNLVTFNSPGTYNPPADIHTIKVTVQGGGGGGGGSSANKGGGGGGGGGTAIEHIEAASVPGPVSVTVGGGGPAGSGVTSSTTAPSGGSGGASSFGTFCSATGGGGGSGGDGPESPGSAGSGSGGDLNASGGAANYQDSGAAGGGNFFGGGGCRGMDRSNASNHDGLSGGGKGSGGGGGGRSTTQPVAGGNGGSGQAGFVLIEEYFG